MHIPACVQGGMHTMQDGLTEKHINLVAAAAEAAEQA